ncbi:AAA family ATPase [Geosporobacter ferrireducens]|uniref:Bacterial transcriptional activator domain-containing protein n=1 Tax=Geosporobacter ferrireducens TaxID=1424294 RepID=A0A1D8GGB1_9FIRM|nr:AAA family ATPase [Geosporobacter ferrireducens]AOT69939.1 hypothetical protein Gferi_10295 [Geosporobacter ferrireducens]
MDLIQVKLFSTPTITQNGEIVFLPFRKAEALFYYLLVHQQATRDELVGLLWPEAGEETAKKNLRQAMYKIRKAFDAEVIISPQKSMVMLNPQIPIETDLKTFLEDAERGHELYTGEFLQGFFLKEGNGFEEWLLLKREQYRDQYIARLNRLLEEHYEKNLLEDAEYFGKLIITADPFDERTHRFLMLIYEAQGSFHKALELYRKLADQLWRELGIAPDQETTTLYQQMSSMKKARDKQPEDFFYGRYREINALNHAYHRFTVGEDGKAALLVGEAGVGKSKLKSHFVKSLQEEKLLVLEANCYQAEERDFLKPWQTIFGKLSELLIETDIRIPAHWQNILAYLFPSFAAEKGEIKVNPVEQIDRLKFQVAEEAVLGLLKLISQNKKLVFVFEDLQWMDPMSLSLLSSILLHKEHSPIWLIATCRNSYGKEVDRFIASMSNVQLMEKISLSRFTKPEVEEFISGMFPEHMMTPALKNRVYHETEGNAFFLVEYLNAIRGKGNPEQMSAKIQDVLRCRLLDLSEESMKLLNIASLFFDKVSLRALKILSRKEEMEILDIIEELQSKYILIDTEEEESAFTFTHQKLREFIYLQLSPARRKILHGKVAHLLEQSLQHDHRDRLVYSRLIYHFTHAGNRLAALKYEIMNLDIYLDFSHELFPLLEDEDLEKEKIQWLKEEEALKQFNHINRSLEQFKKDVGEKEEYLALKIMFLHMEGRYYIKEGEYSQGLDVIYQMIEAAHATKNSEYLLKGYRQMIYYGIQVHDIEQMAEYVEKGLALARTLDQQKEMGIFLRLKGLNKIMAGEFDGAEEMLHQSIEIFQRLNRKEDKYSLNIAAAYHYIGEIRRYNMKFSGALHYYEQAIGICEEKNVFRGSTIFYTHGGQAAFDMGDYLRAKNYFKKAIDTYNQLDTLWGRSTAEGYMALLLIKEGDYGGALDSLLRAEKFGEKLKSPYERALLCRVKAEIRVSMKNNKALQKVFSGVLPVEAAVYCKQGIQLLQGIRESYEIDILQVLSRS